MPMRSLGFWGRDGGGWAEREIGRGGWSRRRLELVDGAILEEEFELCWAKDRPDHEDDEEDQDDEAQQTSKDRRTIFWRCVQFAGDGETRNGNRGSGGVNCSGGK
ncbi:hypothetical protein HPP92_013391 [Vanilla planifolia]|uniref:Uncharacterized protein n=1 Tax=Vanilla planifolia TaxID=51239 RepID=A0A835UYC6_VANPL|nr:hypothetical protein HPP92_013821 [Vanilla planifolia]KAG0478672.1 hypothetical protein HPP92_013391 [Vanilla planifolia]